MNGYMEVVRMTEWDRILSVFFLVVSMVCLSLTMSINAHADYTGTIETEDGSVYTVQLYEDAVVTPAPPDPTPSAYDVELMTHLGNIEAFMIFFAVVILCFFVYKFLRIFF